MSESTHTASAAGAPPLRDFVHLNVHSEYSLSDGLASPKALAGAAAAAGMGALAVTERGNLFSAVRAYRASMAAGLKPLLGCDLELAREREDEAGGRMLLLGMHHEGHRALSRLVSRSFVEASGSGGAPRIARAWLDSDSDGLIALVGRESEFGELLVAGREDAARRWLAPLAALFEGRLYIELTRVGAPSEAAFNELALHAAMRDGLPVVATNAVRFLAAEDFEAHEARVCINEGRRLDDSRRRSRFTEAQYLRSPAEMSALFADVPEALDNSVEIARRCSLDLPLGTAVLPDFEVPEGHSTESWLRHEAENGLARRIDHLSRLARYPVDAARYRERLHSELEVIIGTGFPGYFLIVADFIAWARANDVPVGPGRGSGAGSLVAYSLGIIDIDPIRHDLLFERFLNAERVSMPDFDIDFCMDRRERVLEYVARRYAGRTGSPTDARVSQIVTFGTMAARAVVRDVGRVLGHGYGFCDQLAKLVPFQLGITLDQALEDEPALAERYADEDDVRQLIDLARKLEGMARNAGKHAGGVVIAPSAITDFSALYCEPGGGNLVTQLDKNDVESAGLVKFDFLGLRTLTIIDNAVRTINEVRAADGEAPLDMSALGDDDAATYELVRTGRTTAVFQLESRGMQDLVRRLEPDCFDDLVALVALYRPGPLQSGMVDDFIARKHGAGQVAYVHPSLEPALCNTYGVILYQEQVMQIAQVLAGYTLGGADQLRRAMGKKDPVAMAEHQPRFVDGAVARGVDRHTATGIFELMAKFAEYGFNKSHSAAYAVLTYQTAWLKRHHPAAFMAAVLTADMDDTDKVVVMVDECRALGLEVLSPDVNACAFEFRPAGTRAVRYGLGAIKGVGSGAVASVIEARADGGPFADLFDFCRRVDVTRLNRRALEALVCGGALDAIGPTRASTFGSIERALAAAEQHHRDAAAGQDDLFGGATAEPQGHAYAELPPWRASERLAHEHDALGLYLSGHPAKAFAEEMQALGACPLNAIEPGRGSCLLGGWVLGLRTSSSRSGRQAFLTLDDGTARTEARVLPRSFDACRPLLAKDRLLFVEGRVELDRMTGVASVLVDRLMTLDALREQRARGLRLRIDGSARAAVPALKALLGAHRHGRVPVELSYRLERPVSARANGCALASEVTLPLGPQWTVAPSEDLLDRLRDLCGEGAVSVRYS